jgi:RnfABCDGE-type electron transport complex B subunit
MTVFIIIGITLGFSFFLAMAIGVLLGVAKEKFKVERNPLIDRVRVALPGVNCGACGYAGCDAYAVAVAEKGAALSLCTSGGQACASAIGAVMGKDVKVEDQVTFLRCQGTREFAKVKGSYSGMETCRGSKLATNGIKLCSWGCMGFGDCVKVCLFDALSIGPGGIPVVDYSKCTGCGMCEKECPQGLFAMVPKSRSGAIPLCSNRAAVKQTVGKACKVGCIKCELCVKACVKGAIKMADGLPVVDYGICDSCGECVKKCPTKVFRLIQDVKAGAPAEYLKLKASAPAEA